MEDKYRILIEKYGWQKTEYVHTLRKGDLQLQWIGQLRIYKPGTPGCYLVQEYFDNDTPVESIEAIYQRLTEDWKDIYLWWLKKK
jgi:hypothetical protein